MYLVLLCTKLELSWQGMVYEGFERCELPSNAVCETFDCGGFRSVSPFS